MVMTTFHDLLPKIVGSVILMEDRVKKGYNTYGIVNQGELKSYRNPYDGDLWDIVIPGYDVKIRSKTLIVDFFIGALLVEDGNHKIFVTIDRAGFDEKRATEDMELYALNYRSTNKLHCVWDLHMK